MFKRIKKWILKYIVGHRVWDEATEGCIKVEDVCWRVVENLWITKNTEVRDDVQAIWRSKEANEEEQAKVIVELCKRIGVTATVSKVSGKTIAIGNIRDMKVWFSYLGNYQEVLDVNLVEAVKLAKPPSSLDYTSGTSNF